jgi:cysteine desulfurase / selenocysteine lyase
MGAVAGAAVTANERLRGEAVREGIRGDFPILSRTFRRGEEEIPLVYLDNAATTQKPRAVIDAIVGYYERTNANVHRSLHTLGEEATEAYEASRRRVAAFIGARSASEVVFTRGTTESLNLVAASLGKWKVGRGDRILLTEMEHHSNLVPWQLAAAERGAELAFIPFDSQGRLELDGLEALLGERTRIVSLTMVSNVFGTVNDVRRVAALAHRHGALVVVDAAQAVPHVGVDVAALDCDFLAFSGHKVYGPMGIGALWGREHLLEEMPPWMGGGEMIRSVWLDHATWNDPPYKLEAGTPNVEGAVGLAAALDYVGAVGVDAIEAHEADLARHALASLGAVPGLRIHGPASDRAGVVSFELEGVHPHDLAQFLDGRGIAIRAGHHCAQPLMRKLGVPALARASFALYTTRGEIDELARGVREAVRYFSHAA